MAHEGCFLEGGYMVTKEERFYTRLQLDIPCTVYSGDNEAPGRVVNICEDGIGVSLSYEDYKMINPVRHIRLLIQFIDEVDFIAGKSLEDILLTVEVVHEEDTGKGFVIGCHVDESINCSMEYSKYVDLKKARDFISSSLLF